MLTAELAFHLLPPYDTNLFLNIFTKRTKK